MRIMITGEPDESTRLMLEVVTSLLLGLSIKIVPQFTRDGTSAMAELSLSREDETMLADFLEMRKSQRRN